MDLLTPMSTFIASTEYKEMFKRQRDLKHASKNQLRAWIRMFEPGTVERNECEDELLFRKYQMMYGTVNAQSMMDTLCEVRERYEKRISQSTPPVVEQPEIDWDSLPPA